MSRKPMTTTCEGAARVDSEATNIDPNVVHHFGYEWERFDQSDVDNTELQELFARYFAIFPWDELPSDACGFDLGCGSGRWAAFVAPRVARLHCIDPSSAALAVARRKLQHLQNCEFHEAGVDDIPLTDESMDFGYSIGVLHHIPRTLDGLRACVAKLKLGGVMLVYLYYAFDNKPWWFRAIWRASDFVRARLSRMPERSKTAITNAIALTVYLPLARLGLGLEKLGIQAPNLPLWDYRHRSFYIMRNDALDRFGTRLEQRFTRAQIKDMMEAAGLSDVRFSDERPFWCAVGTKC